VSKTGSADSSLQLVDDLRDPTAATPTSSEIIGVSSVFRLVLLSHFLSPFGALRGRWLTGILAGTLYALGLYRRGELTDAIVAHATTNALIAAYVLTTGSWSIWMS
jgi:hypothetical protein